MIEKMLCQYSKTLLDVMQLMNENGKGVVFVSDNQDRLCGVITDGDIRRALLGGKTLQTAVGEVVRHGFVYASTSEDREHILSKLNERVWIIPIVDDAMRVLDYVEFRKDFRVPIASPDLRGNEFKYLVDAFLSTWISSKGKYIERFEREFADYIGTKYAIATSNGTTALHLALLVCGVGHGDEVIVPDLTFAATINVVLHANAKPVIVDVESDSWCMDPSEIEKAITPRTRAIIPVHLYGQPCNMDAIMSIAREHKLFVVEDCAEAHGATYKDKKIGAIGDFGCFSFFGNKIITCGEGGMCLTNNKKFYEIALQLRDHGMSTVKKYWHDRVGFNYRMTNLQAAIGVAQLERIEDILKSREELEKSYRSLLAGVEDIEFQKNDFADRKRITWLVNILVRRTIRDVLVERLKKGGFDVRNFFYPLSFMDIYKEYVFSNSNSSRISCKGISLPTGMNITKEMISRIGAILKQVE